MKRESRRESGFPWRSIRGVVWDWGDTLMKDIPGQEGPMAAWPRVEAMPGAASALKALSVLPVQCVATNATDSDGDKVAEALERVGLLDHLAYSFTSFARDVVPSWRPCRVHAIRLAFPGNG